MNLKDFIQQTLNDIEQAKDNTKSFEQVRGVIDFDVAVVANENGGAKASISVFGIGSGEFGGQLDNTITSRIRFKVQTKGAISPGE